MASGNRHYQNGRALEYRAKKRLEEEGWTVTRTPGSKTPADLWAVRGIPVERFFFRDERRLYVPQLRFVQCKSGTGRMTKAARTKFELFAHERGGEAWLVERGMKFTKLEPA